MVRLQKMLVNHLGIERLLAVAGGSMGGMQALEWAVAFPDAVAAAIPIAATARHSAQQIAFNEVGRQAIMADPDWYDGDYYDRSLPPADFPSRAWSGHITYMSDDSMREKFGRRFARKEAFSFDFDVFRGGELSPLSRQPVRRPLRRELVSVHHQGDGLVRPHQRPAVAGRGAGARASAIPGDQLHVRLAVSDLSVAGDRERVRGRNRDVAFCELPSNYGHDAFLVDVGEQTDLVRGFLASTFARTVARAS